MRTRQESHESIRSLVCVASDSLAFVDTQYSRIDQSGTPILRTNLYVAKTRATGESSRSTATTTSDPLHPRPLRADSGGHYSVGTDCELKLT